jgi:thioredoxin 2
MAEPLVFRCSHCGAFNRLSLLVPGREPICGKCKSSLDVAGHPSDIDPAGFDKAVAAAPALLLVDFWAPWCGPCRTMAPVLEELGRQTAGRLVVAKLNTDHAPEISQRLGIEGIPTMILFRGGREVDRLVGAHPLPEVKRFVDQAAVAINPS